MMSVERWESVTWDLIEREIVDYLLIASERPEKPGQLTRLLVKRLKPGVVSRKDGKNQRRSFTNG